MAQAIRGGCIIQWPEAIRFVIAVLLPRRICIIAEIFGNSIGEGESLLGFFEYGIETEVYINLSKSSMSHSAIRLLRSSANLRASLVNCEDVTITD